MKITVNNKTIANGNKIFFIAEAGVNHNGSTELGFRLIDKAVEAGADAIKFQSFKAEKLNTRKAPKSSYHIETTGGDETQSWFELLKSQEISTKMHQDLWDYCNKKNIVFLSTPYDEESADLLEELGIEMFKLASTDTTNLRLLQHIAKKKKPMILSTAMCSMKEVEEAVNVLKEAGLPEYAVLQCTGNYPSRIEDTNLSVISTFKEKFNCVVGYSDHTLEKINPILSVALGIGIYEKHFTLDRDLPGPDHRMSLTPSEMTETILNIRLAETALGSTQKSVLPDELENRDKLRKSITAKLKIYKGEPITDENIIMKRPGTGIQPRQLKNIKGMIAKIDIEEDELIEMTMLESTKN